MPNPKPLPAMPMKKTKPQHMPAPIAAPPTKAPAKTPMGPGRRY